MLKLYMRLSRSFKIMKYMRGQIYTGCVSELSYRASVVWKNICVFRQTSLSQRHVETSVPKTSITMTKEQTKRTRDTCENPQHLTSQVIFRVPPSLPICSALLSQKACVGGLGWPHNAILRMVRGESERGGGRGAALVRGLIRSRLGPYKRRQREARSSAPRLTLFAKKTLM